jgi:tellurite resistance protein TerC
LSTGLSLILAFIGVKLILQWAHEDLDPRVPKVPTLLSLGVIVAVLAVVTVASLLRTRRDPSAKARPGSLRARRVRSEEQRRQHG